MTPSSPPTAAGNGDELKILVCSANMGNAEPTLSSIQEWVPRDGACDKVTPLDDDHKDQLSCGNFDLIAIGMQESTWSKKKSKKKSPKKSTSAVSDEDSVSSSSSDEEDNEEEAEGAEKEEAKEDITENEEDEGKDDSNTKYLIEKFEETIGSDKYTLLAQQLRGQMRLLIWIRKELKDLVTNVKVKCENTGIAHVMANKGGIVCTLTYRKTRITFLTAHLAAHEGDKYYANRCDNLREILRGAKTFEKYDTAISSHHMFVIGDLNFRTKFPEKQQSDETTEQAGKKGKELKEKERLEKVKRALDLVEAKNWKELYSFDELQAGIAKKELLVDFKTLPCNFSPTFKVQREPGIVYKQQRTPSYTDRILFKSADGLEGNFKPLAYEPCPGFITSDHKPIRGAFSIIPNDATTKTAEQTRNKELLPDKVQLVFSDMQAFDLPSMDVDGKSDPYIVLFANPAEMLVDKSGIMKTSKVWAPKSTYSTKFIKKSLNPSWGNEKITMVLDTSQLGPEAMLFVTMFDYDAMSQDDLMCTVALNVEKLISVLNEEGEIAGGITEMKEVWFEQPLLKYGTEQGRIKFKVAVEAHNNNAGQQKKKKRSMVGKATSMFSFGKSKK